MVRVFEPPVYCYHEIVHNRLVVEEFRAPGRRLRRRRRRGPRRRAAHALGPRLGPRGRAGRRRARPRRRQRRLPARDQGPPRAQGAGRARATRSSTSATPATRRRSARWRSRRRPSASSSARTTSTRSRARPGTPGRAARPDHARPTTSGPGSPTARASSASPTCGCPGAPTSATRRPTARPRCGRSPAAATPSSCIGSANSSNTVSLTQVAAAAGCPTGAPGQRRRRAPRRPRRRRRRHRRRLGSGVARRRGRSTGSPRADGVEVVHAVEEDEYFPPPPELRDLLRARVVRRLGRARPAAVGTAAPAEDREVPAARMLTGRAARPARRLACTHRPPLAENGPAMNARETRRQPPSTSSSTASRSRSSAPPTASPRFAPVAIVIAAYNERDNIGRVVEALPDELCGTSVVGRSSSSTARTTAPPRSCANPATTPVIAPVNRGQGAALRLGYRVAREHGARYIVTADADGQTDPADLAVVLRPVVDGRGRLRQRLAPPRRAPHRPTSCATSGSSFFSRAHHAAHRHEGDRRRQPDPGDARRAAERPHPRRAAVPGLGAADRGDHARRRATPSAPSPCSPRASGRSKKGGNLVYGYRYSRVVLRTWWREARRRRGR